MFECLHGIPLSVRKLAPILLDLQKQMFMIEPTKAAMPLAVQFSRPCMPSQNTKPFLRLGSSSMLVDLYFVDLNCIYGSVHGCNFLKKKHTNMLEGITTRTHHVRKRVCPEFSPSLAWCIPWSSATAMLESAQNFLGFVHRTCSKP